MSSSSSDSEDDTPLNAIRKSAPPKVAPSLKKKRFAGSSSDDDSDGEPIKVMKRADSSKRMPPKAPRPPRVTRPRPTPRRTGGVKRSAPARTSGRPAKRPKTTPRRPTGQGYSSLKDRMVKSRGYPSKPLPLQPLATQKGVPKWWDCEAHKPPKKWESLDHNGIVFAPPYEPHGIQMLYNGRKITLSPAQEEVATFFAAILLTDHAKNPVFQVNFFKDWRKLLRSEKEPIRHLNITDFKLCDFRPIHQWTVDEKEKLKLLRKTKSFKEKRKMEKEDFDSIYGYALVDGVREKLGNYKVEPPGLFRGRGEHPKKGKLKMRIMPEDVIMNIKRGAPIPPCPLKGHNWAGVIHDNTVTYIAKWVENINGSHKFVYLDASSRFKGEADRAKYEKARKLKKIINKIRRDYESKLTSKSLWTRQLATAVWMIDRLSIRVGNEKNVEEEADTVGVCSLRREHIFFKKDQNRVKLKFLGKDSMPYENEVKVPPIIFANLGYFCKGKKPDQMIFAKIDPSAVNEYLKEQMPGLSAKVFRTHNASVCLDEQLWKPAIDGVKCEIKSNEPEKVFFYDSANRKVAVLCNHMKTVNEDKFAEGVTKLAEKIKARKKIVKNHERGLALATNRAGSRAGDTEEALKIARKDPTMIRKQLQKHKSQLQKMEFNMRGKNEGKEIALGTSKINYMDPRITVAWCKRMECPIERVFTKNLLTKFNWAMAVEPEYRF